LFFNTHLNPYTAHQIYNKPNLINSYEELALLNSTETAVIAELEKTIGCIMDNLISQYNFFVRWCDLKDVFMKRILDFSYG